MQKRAQEEERQRIEEEMRQLPLGARRFENIALGKHE
jgi:hypothetical protein